MAQAEPDIELASGSRTGHTAAGRLRLGFRSRLWPSISRGLESGLRGTTQLLNGRRQGRRTQIEDFPTGYPRFTALIGAYAPFYICRRFSGLRARLLLLKQDKLSLLEEQLETIDRDEVSPLFLGNFRRDRNAERGKVLSDIGEALADYDHFIDRTRKVLGYSNAKGQNINSLQNWLEGNPDIMRTETDFLARDDLIEVSASYDDALASFQRYLVKITVHCFRGFRTMSFFDISKDSRVFIFSGPLLNNVVRILIVWLIVVLLLVPILIILAISNVWLRMLLIIVASGSFISALSAMTKARTGELFLAGATYATILVVFVAGNNSPSI